MTDVFIPIIAVPFYLFIINLFREYINRIKRRIIIIIALITVTGIIKAVLIIITYNFNIVI